LAEALPHPRDVYRYERGEAVEGAFLDAFDRGKLHHAWMLTGPEGVGKATFAYRAARRLLGARPAPEYGLLGASPDDQASRLVAARSHPDFMALERAVEDGKTKKFISVDDARSLPEFFAKAPSISAYRVAIVDAADDMNINAANALLKTLEEPPERGVLFLVAHAPGRLMATLRSRCRRLAFAPWPDEAVEGFLAERTGLPGNEVSALAHMARGAPGRGLRLAVGPALEFEAVADVLVNGEFPGEAALLHLADSFRGGEGQARFELFFERLAEAVHRRVTGQGGKRAVERWGALWDRLSGAAGEAEAINLDRADMFWTLIADLKAVRAMAEAAA
jgi:DNA polymerase-3 subunit delta'